MAFGYIYEVHIPFPLIFIYAINCVAANTGLTKWISITIAGSAAPQVSHFRSQEALHRHRRVARPADFSDVQNNRAVREIQIPRRHI